MFSYNITRLLSHGLSLIINPTTTGIRPIIVLIVILIVCAFAIILFVFLICKRTGCKNTETNDNPTSQILPVTHNDSDNVEISTLSRMTRSMKIEELNKDLEPFGFAYYPKQDLFYAIMDGWQRGCGYCELYDEAATVLSMIIDREPIRFEYEGKKWLIEFWKGQYGLTTGCEVGIYTTKGPDLNIPGIFDGTFYLSASEDDFLQISYSLNKHGSLLFSRNELHWWLTGFKLGVFSEPSELTMNITIKLKDEVMCSAFIDGLLEAGYSENDLTIMDNTVQLIFDKPHSPQAITRTSLTEYFVQTFNKRNCEAYQSATKRFGNTLDKLGFVKIEAPKMYYKIINVGSTKELFGSYKTINKYIIHDEINNE